MTNFSTMWLEATYATHLFPFPILVYAIHPFEPIQENSVIAQVLLKINKFIMVEIKCDSFVY